MVSVVTFPICSFCPACVLIKNQLETTHIHGRKTGIHQEKSTLADQVSLIRHPDYGNQFSCLHDVKEIILLVKAEHKHTNWSRSHLAKNRQKTLVSGFLQNTNDKNQQQGKTPLKN